MNSKLIFSALGLAALLATPAMAQKANKRALSPAAATVVYPDGGVYSNGYSNGGSYYDSRMIGTDPDLRIRSELMRDAPTAQGLN